MFDSPVLTPGNHAALDAIYDFTRRRGFGPTLRELAQLLGVKAHTTARHHVLRLEALQLVTLQRTGTTGRISSYTVRLTAAGEREVARYRARNR